MSEQAQEPDFIGIGRAWEMRAGPQARQEQSASLIGYVLHGPWHPFWHWWMVSVVHLRPIDGQAANKRYPEAEYEFMIVSIDPETPPDPAETFPQDVKYLTPIDVVEQFDGVSDDDARGICTAAVRAITQGGASPDQDYRSWWADAIRHTVEHYKAGLHSQGGSVESQ